MDRVPVRGKKVLSTNFVQILDLWIGFQLGGKTYSFEFCG
jgi:hypothetical protein